MQTVSVPNPNSPYVKHRLGGWMPSNPEHWRKWLKKTVEHVSKHHQKEFSQLHPSIQQFWTLIETNTEVRMLFSMMLEQVPIKPPYNKNPAGGQEFRDWKEMLTVFDYQLTQGPVWLYNTSGQQGLIGFPFNAFLVINPQLHMEYLLTVAGLAYGHTCRYIRYASQGREQMLP
jgi:phosphatidylserine decarboxylase